MIFVLYFKSYGSHLWFGYLDSITNDVCLAVLTGGGAKAAELSETLARARGSPEKHESYTKQKKAWTNSHYRLKIHDVVIRRPTRCYTVHSGSGSFRFTVHSGSLLIDRFGSVQFTHKSIHSGSVHGVSVRFTAFMYLSLNRYIYIYIYNIYIYIYILYILSSQQSYEASNLVT